MIGGRVGWSQVTRIVSANPIPIPCSWEDKLLCYSARWFVSCKWRRRSPHSRQNNGPFEGSNSSRLNWYVWVITKCVTGRWKKNTNSTTQQGTVFWNSSWGALLLWLYRRTSRWTLVIAQWCEAEKNPEKKNVLKHEGTKTYRNCIHFFVCWRNR